MTTRAPLFTQYDIEGFSDDELATMNAAADRLFDHWGALGFPPEPEMGKAISDALSNAFRDGITADELVAACLPTERV